MPWKDFPGKPVIGPAEALMLPSRLALVFEVVEADVVSLMAIVIVSPM